MSIKQIIPSEFDIIKISTIVDIGNSAREFEMKIDSKKVIDMTMYLPFSLALGGATMYLGSILALLVVFGQISMPETADYDSILKALGYSFFIFLGLLGIPRAILYIKGFTKKRWTFLMYWAVPIVLVFLVPDAWFPYVKLGIAACAWLEVLLILNPFHGFMGEDLPPRQ